MAKTNWAHGKRNLALRLAGLMPIICLVADGSGVCGGGIFDASPEDVERIVALDPGVQAGVFTLDVHQTRSFRGSCLPLADARVSGADLNPRLRIAHPTHARAGRARAERRS